MEGLRLVAGSFTARLVANAIPYQIDNNIDFAVDKLIEYRRPRAAINCLERIRHVKKTLNIGQCVRALLAAISSTEPFDSMYAYHIIELIKVLQKTPEVSYEDLFTLEWKYLQLLDGNMRGAVPKLLENRLTDDPEFFCNVIRLIYRSKKQDTNTSEPSEEAKGIATNAWHLLYKWRTPPGMQQDGSFNDAHFFSWLQRVIEICIKTGHLEVALISVGRCLSIVHPIQMGYGLTIL